MEGLPMTIGVQLPNMLINHGDMIYPYNPKGWLVVDGWLMVGRSVWKKWYLTGQTCGYSQPAICRWWWYNYEKDTLNGPKKGGSSTLSVTPTHWSGLIYVDMILDLISNENGIFLATKFGVQTRKMEILPAHGWLIVTCWGVWWELLN
jgi:hypothetical protein